MLLTFVIYSFAFATAALWSDAFVEALFVQPPFQVNPYPLFLVEADRLGIPYRGIASDSGKAASNPGFSLSLNAEFGALDESTFNALQRVYCQWSETKSRVKWKKGRKYTFLDFLPPLLQATSGLHFRSSRTVRDLPSFLNGQVEKYVEQDVLLTSNCWGFAWELLLQADNADIQALTISTADPTSAWRAFTGPSFDLIQSSRAKPKLLEDPVLRNKKLKGGDVLLIWHKNPTTASGSDLYLDHVATLIDKDVYYEKSGSGDRVPFRLNTWEGLVKNFPTSIFFWEWRRLVRNNPLSPQLYAGPGNSLTSLRPATEIFGVDAQLPAIANDSKYNAASRDGFALLGKLRPSVAQRISLQADPEEGGLLESQLYTGILVLEDLVFDKETGRASLPKSAFMREFFTMMDMMKNPYRKGQ